MFAVLDIRDEAELASKEKFKRWLFGGRPDVYWDDANGVEFVRIMCSIYKNTLPWRYIAQAAELVPAGILLPHGLNFPEKFNITLCDGSLYQRMLFQKAIPRILRESGADSRGLDLCFLDYKGLRVQWILPLPSFFERITVITNNADAYESFVRKAWEETGTPVVVTDNNHAVLDSGVIIAPDGINGELSGDIKRVVFACGYKGENPKVFSKCLVILPDDIMEICPAGINPTDFAAALYRTSPFCFTSKLESEYLQCREGIYTIGDIAEMISRLLI